MNTQSGLPLCFVCIYVEKQEMTKKIGVIFLFVCWSVCALAQPDSLSVAERNALQGFNDTIDRLAEDFVTVSLVVCDPGDFLFSSFGHAVLRLQCPTFDKDYIFSYESEDKKGHWLRFLRGDLKEGLFGIPSDSYFQYCRAEERGVVEYKLKLSPTQEMELWKNLDELVARGTKLPYDYYTRGCALSIVNVVKSTLHNISIEYNEWPEKFDGTLRELGYECVSKAQQPWNRFVLMTLAGSGIDNPHIQKEKKLIVPADLAEVWQHATINSEMLLEKEPHFIVPPTLKKTQQWFTPLVICIILLILEFCSLITLWIPQRGLQIVGRVIDYSILATVTFIGVIVTYTVLFSSLPCTNWNWLIIPFNILPILAWYWRKYWAIPWAFLLTIWSIIMTCESLWGHILVEWAHIVLTITFVIIIIKQNKTKRYEKESI